MSTHKQDILIGRMLLKSRVTHRLRLSMGLAAFGLLWLLGDSALATTNFWFTGDTFTRGTLIHNNQYVNPEAGQVQAQISDGTMTISSGPDKGAHASNAQPYAVQITAAPDPVPGRPSTNAIRFEV